MATLSKKEQELLKSGIGKLANVNLKSGIGKLASTGKGQMSPNTPTANDVISNTEAKINASNNVMKPVTRDKVIEIDEVEAKPLPIPTETADTTPLVEETRFVAQNTLNQQQKELERLEAERANKRTEIESLLTPLPGRADFEAQARADKGLDQIDSRLGSLDEKIASRQHILDQQAIRDQAALDSFENTGMGVPQAVISAKQTRVNREQQRRRNTMTSELNSYIAMREAVQGQYDRAEAAVERQTDLEFADREQKVKNSLQMLDWIGEDIGEEKEELTRLYKTQEEELKTKKESLKEARNLALKALENGASQSEVARLMSDPDLTLDKVVESVGNFVAKDEGPIIEEVGDNLLQWNPETGQFDVVFSAADAAGPNPGQILSQGGSTYDVIASSAGGKQVEGGFVDDFTKGINVVGQIEELQNTFNTDDAFGDAGADLAPILGTIRSKNKFDDKAQIIKAQLQAIVPNLARGIYGEVGVLTDADIKNYAETLPNLTNTQEVREAVLGLTLQSVKRSLENQLRNRALAGYDVSGLGSQLEIVERQVGETMAPIYMKSQPVNDLIKAGANKTEIETLLRDGYDMDEVINYYTSGGSSGFSAVAPDTNQGQAVDFNTGVKQIMEAVAIQESGGDYNKRGPVIDNPNSPYYGERAMGKYQVMPGNLPQWSREALGYEVTPEQFMASPQLQEAIAMYQFGKNIQQYGNVDDAVSVWFTGRPAAEGANAQDTLGTSGSQYVSNFRKNLSKVRT